MPPPEQYKIYYRHKAQKEKYRKKHKEQQIQKRQILIKEKAKY